MRIAIVATNGPELVGGLSAYLRGLVTELGSEEPVTCVVRYNRTGGGNLSYARGEPPRVERSEACETHVLSAPRIGLLPLHLARRLMYHSRTQGLAQWIFAGFYARQIDRSLPKEVDVIHVIGTAWEMLGPTVVPLARRRSAAVTVWPAIHPGTWGDSNFDGAFYRRTDLVFAQSQHERHRLLELGVQPERVRVCGLAPATGPTGDGIAFRTQHGLGDRPIVLFVGRKQRYKGFHALVAAMAAVTAVIPDALLVAIGADVDGRLSDLPPYLLDLGQAPDGVKADALAACDVFCLPSSGEAFGIAYVEAWAVAKPVVGGPAPAVRELIREGVDGFCSSQDPSELADVLVSLLQDPSLRRRLGQAGHQRCLTQYNWPAVADCHRTGFEAARQGVRSRAGV